MDKLKYSHSIIAKYKLPENFNNRTVIDQCHILTQLFSVEAVLSRGKEKDTIVVQTKKNEVNDEKVQVSSDVQIRNQKEKAKKPKEPKENHRKAPELSKQKIYEHLRNVGTKSSAKNVGCIQVISQNGETVSSKESEADIFNGRDEKKCATKLANKKSPGKQNARKNYRKKMIKESDVNGNDVGGIPQIIEPCLVKEDFITLTKKTEAKEKMVRFHDDITDDIIPIKTDGPSSEAGTSILRKVLSEKGYKPRRKQATRKKLTNKTADDQANRVNLVRVESETDGTSKKGVPAKYTDGQGTIPKEIVTEEVINSGEPEQAKTFCSESGTSKETDGISKEGVPIKHTDFLTIPKETLTNAVMNFGEAEQAKTSSSESVLSKGKPKKATTRKMGRKQNAPSEKLDQGKPPIQSTTSPIENQEIVHVVNGTGQSGPSTNCISKTANEMIPPVKDIPQITDCSLSPIRLKKINEINNVSTKNNNERQVIKPSQRAKANLLSIFSHISAKYTKLSQSQSSTGYPEPVFPEKEIMKKKRKRTIGKDIDA